MTKRDTQLRALRKRVKDDRAAALNSALALADSPDPSVAADLEFALSRVSELDRRLAILPKPAVKVTEPDLYARGSRHSFFRDLAASSSPVPVRGIAPVEAIERLQRHARFEEVRRAGDTRIAEGLLSARGIQVRRAEDGLQRRALASTSVTTGGPFVPPTYLVDEFASVARAAAPLRQLLPTMKLPDGTLQLVIPRFDAVAGIVPMSAENTDPTDVYSDPTPATDDVTADVATFAAMAKVSQQVIDRSDLDAVITRDLAEAYAEALQQQLINGTGANGQLLGFRNVSGIETVTWTSTTPTPTALVTQIGATAAAVSNARLRPPSFSIMRPARYFWIASQPDGSTNTPMERVGTGMVCDGDSGPVGPVAGLPAILDGTIPTDLGAGTNQDVILTVRAADQLLLEDVPRFSVNFDVAGAANALSGYFVMHRYAAAFTNRYPASIGLLTGTGMAVPTGW